MNPYNENEKLKGQQELEQALANIAESLPPMWRRMYLNLIKEGFTKDETMEILKTYVSSMRPR